jgi:hypothetical protein
MDRYVRNKEQQVCVWNRSPSFNARSLGLGQVSCSAYTSWFGRPSCRQSSWEKRSSPVGSYTVKPLFPGALTVCQAESYVKGGMLRVKKENATRSNEDVKSQVFQAPSLNVEAYSVLIASNVSLILESYCRTRFTYAFSNITTIQV